MDTEQQLGGADVTVEGTLLVTGGCGFIGSNFIRAVLRAGAPTLRVVNLDKLTYAGRLENLAEVAGDPRYQFVRGDICDPAAVEQVFRQHRPQAVLHLAAESHVDRSIAHPQTFVRTNVEGTLVLLEAARRFWAEQPLAEQTRFRFVHVSTDEVFGTLAAGAPPFTEASCYAPRSPYAASKAAADHMVRAFSTTYGLPVILGNCSNNYGPYQLPEKLIPLLIRFALQGRTLPVYGDGQQARDWLHVADHCTALRLLLRSGQPGETYTIGGGQERSNLAVVHAVCALLDQQRPRAQGSYAEQIRFVADRPGHDRRYAVDSTKLRRELGWRPLVASLEQGLAATVAWYLEHEAWMESVMTASDSGPEGSSAAWLEENYGRR